MVAGLRAAWLTLGPGVTFLVGENGSGKSTLVEGVAVAAGLNPEGGSRSFAFATRSSESSLGSALRLGRAPGRERTSFFLRAESYYNVATEVERLDAEPGPGARLLPPTAAPPRTSARTASPSSICSSTGSDRAGSSCSTNRRPRSPRRAAWPR